MCHCSESAPSREMMISDCRFPFILCILNSERDKHAKGKNTLPIWTEFYSSVCDCSSTQYLTILPRLISVSRCQVLQEILLVFVQQNFLNNMPTFYESAFFTWHLSKFSNSVPGCHVIALKSAKCWCIVWNFLLQENQWNLLVHLTTGNTKYPGNPVRYHVKLQSQTLLVEICPNR